MKLLIQIPCLNEEEHLEATFRDLPRHIDGIDEIEVLIVDDGSTDRTSAVAEDIGVHHIVRFPRNRGLSAAYRAGLDACLRLGADIIVNTDADNQYPGADIPRLVAPILEGKADVVVGDRQTDKIAHFSLLKKALQRWGSGLVRRLSGTDVADATSGFRAVNRQAAAQIFVHNRFTYTLETIIQIGASGLVATNVQITTNPQTRSSRLFKSIPDYLLRNGPVILRSYAMYRPVQSFAIVALLLFLVGFILGARFLVLYLLNPDYSGHIQSLTVAVGSFILAFLVGLIALTAELIATNRRMLEEVLMRVRRLEASSRGVQQIDGVYSTGAPPWRGEVNAASPEPRSTGSGSSPPPPAGEAPTGSTARVG